MTTNAINNVASSLEAGNILIASSSLTGTSGDITLIGDGTNDIICKNSTTDLLTITDNGDRLLPFQPAFLVLNSANDTNRTGNGAEVLVDYNSETFDIGGNFASDQFTAPITGRYYLRATVRIGNISTLMTTALLSLVTLNRIYRFKIAARAITNSSNPGANWQCMIGMYTDMDASDIASCTVLIANGSGNTATIIGSTTQITSCFCGVLVG